MKQEASIPDNSNYIKHILQVTAVILLPAFLGALFGWVQGLLPLLVFYYLLRYGAQLGKKFILFGCGLACIGGLAFQVFDQILFSLTLLPVGFILADSARKGESISIAGLKGTVVLAGSWLLVTSLLSFGLEHHPYILLINGLDAVMDEAITYHKVNNTFPAETLFLLEQSFTLMKVWIPKVMPGILMCIILVITFFTMAVGNRMLHKNVGTGPWPEFRLWSLPEKVIWVFIGAAILFVLPFESGRILGLNILMLSTLLYCFQGLAILLFLFSKWSVPLLLRTLIYVLLFFQSFGVILLAILGVADVWLDVRKLKSSLQETDT
jgi:hypothetical protein